MDNYSFEDYKKCLFGVEGPSHVRYDVQRQIRSKEHKIYTLEINKQTLRAYDDKRFWINSMQSLPWGHARIPETREDDSS